MCVCEVQSSVFVRCNLDYLMHNINNNNLKFHNRNMDQKKLTDQMSCCRAMAAEDCLISPYRKRRAKRKDMQSQQRTQSLQTLLFQNMKTLVGLLLLP